MKLAWRIFWGSILILAAVLLVLDALGVVLPFVSSFGEISVLRAILGLLLVAVLLSCLLKGRIASIFFPLAFLFMLFEKNIAYLCAMENTNIINNWLVLLIALLLTVSFIILFPRHRWTFCKGSKTDKQYKREKHSMGSATVYIDCAGFTKRLIACNLGACTVYFTNVGAYLGEGELIIDNNLGSVVVNVPASWHADVSIDNNLGSVHATKTQNTDSPVLYIKGDNNLGAVNVRYV